MLLARLSTLDVRPFTLAGMQIHLHNSLSRSVDAFEPVDPPMVRMYSCGPTVYDFAHIGNFRSFLTADLVRRTLELAGYDVRSVMNITDVGHMTDDAGADGSGEDKMQVAARRLKEDKKSGTLPEGVLGDPDDPFAVANYYTNAFVDDAQVLGIKTAFEPDHLPRATGHIDAMQAMISTLIEREHAYVGPDGVVYFSVESFPEYGALSGNTLEKLRAGMGGRVLEEHQQHKRHPGDFMLWKPDESHLMKWDAPWGRGYPGWHIECSAIARRVLGADVIDIHTGGEDLAFPHHECEIAQSRGATGCAHFARFFLHTRFLLVDGEKMSKRTGTFYTVRDVLEGRATRSGRTVDPGVLRLALLRAHYRQNLNFTEAGIGESAANVQDLRAAAARFADDAAPADAEVDLSHPMLARFSAALADDLNIAEALAAVFSWLGGDTGDPGEAAAALRVADRVLGVIEPASTEPVSGDTGVDAEALCAQIDEARRTKDFTTSDALRQQLIDAGYDVQTTKDGTVAEKLLA
ncbi:MAG: cysteine--tRNA ligase [Planctomycetota bacterium]